MPLAGAHALWVLLSLGGRVNNNNVISLNSTNVLFSIESDSLNIISHGVIVQILWIRKRNSETYVCCKIHCKNPNRGVSPSVFLCLPCKIYIKFLLISTKTMNLQLNLIVSMHVLLLKVSAVVVSYSILRIHIHCIKIMCWGLFYRNNNFIRFVFCLHRRPSHPYPFKFRWFCI